MKLKGINVFEQYADKMVLGVAAAAALGVVAMQFLGEPNKVTIGKDTLPPARAYDPVARAADELLAKVNSDSPELKEAPKSDALTRFRNDLSRGVAPARTLVAMGPVVGLGATIEDSAGAGGGGPIADLAVPAPALPAARMYAGTVDPLEVVSHPELKSILPAEQPFDKFSVSVECAFDGTAFKQALQSDPDGTGPVRPVPLGWVRDSLEIIGVETEREQLGSDGQWGKATIVPAIPGRPDLLGEFTKSVKSVGDVSPMIQRAQARTEDVLRPEYYTMIAGGPWQPPSEVSDGQSMVQRIDGLTTQINRLDEQLEQMRRQQERQAKSANQPRNQTGPVGGGGRGGAGGRGEAPRSQPEQQQPDKNKPSALENRIAKVTADRERLVKQKEDLLAKQASGGTEKPSTDSTRVPLLENAKVRLWTHDVTVQPGETYRYRVRIVTNNPFYGRDAALSPAQKALAEKSLTRGAWSDWTEPVAVDQKSYYFVTSASDRDAMGPARASVELLEFYYGFYRRADVGVSPGDTLVGDAKLPADLAVFDMEKLASGVRPTAPSGPAGPPGADPRSGRGVAPTPRGEPGALTPATDAKTEAEKAAAEGKKPLPDRRTIALDAVLVDVLKGVDDGSSRAVIRETPGTMVVRRPESAIKGSLLARLQESARQGESQGQPQVKAREPKPDAPLSGPEEFVPSPGKRGGGGGGGGGG